MVSKTPGPQSFPKQNRLLKAAQFQQVFRQGRRLNTPQFIVFNKLNEQPYSRIGLAISKKSIKTAVGRNRVKRLIREGFRHYAWQRGLDLILIAKPSVATLTNDQLTKQLDALWPRLEKITG